MWSGDQSFDALDPARFPQDLYMPFGATLTQAIKCALANCIAFSAVLGRAGPLEAFFVSLFGTIGF